MRAARDANDDFGAIFALKTGQMTLQDFAMDVKMLDIKTF